MTANEYIVLLKVYVGHKVNTQNLWEVNAVHTLREADYIMAQGADLEVTSRGKALCEFIAKSKPPVQEWKVGV